MPEALFKTLKVAVKNWWIHLLAGILFIIVGCWVISTPISSYVGLSILFSVIMFASGLSELIFVSANSKNLDGWGWYLAAAIFDFLIGLVLVAYPGLTMSVLPLLVAFWLMFKGFSAIGISLDLRHYKVSIWGWLLLAGIIAVLFAFLILMNPAIGGLSIVLTTGLAFISIGVFRIMLALRLRRLHEVIGTK